MDTSVEQIVSLYRKFSKIPIPIKGRIIPISTGNVQVSIINKQRDLERSEMIRSQRNVIFNSQDWKKLWSTPAVDVTLEQLRSESTSGLKVAILRKIINGKAEEKQYLEVWENSIKILNLDLSSIKLHGKVYDDDHFGCLQWSRDESKLVYIAEKKQPKAKSFFKFDEDYKTQSPDKIQEGQGDGHDFIEDWGECLVGKHHPIPFILDVESGTVKDIDNLPDYVSIGQAVWVPNNKDLVFVGWWHEPRRLGLSYCSNRRSAIFHFCVDEAKYEIIGKMDKSVHSPRFSPDGSKLIYLESESGGPHNKGSRLALCFWKSKQVEILIDLIGYAPGDEFPGIYSIQSQLPQRVWISDNCILFDTIWHSQQKIVCVNVSSRTHSQVIGNLNGYSWTLLDVWKNILLATISSPNQPPVCVIGKIPDTSYYSGEEIEWAALDITKTIPNIKWNILQYEPTEDRKHPKYLNLKYQGILIEPDLAESNTNGIPLIIWPHGGPHSAHLAAYNLYTALFTNLGFACLLVNYRGSVGFGENSIYSLLGNIGLIDVSDCHLAATTADSRFTREKMLVFGGSHGGFLATHLIGQFPDFYKACVCRNTVIDLSGKIGVSDIPDWNWVESGLSYSSVSLPKIDDLKIMLAKSPVSYLDLVKTPVMLHMGMTDLRVPPSQSLLYYHSLKARNKNVKLLTYDDNHSLSKVDVEADVFINTVLWFSEHII